LGRATSTPAGLLDGAADLQAGYFVNDLVRQLSQDGKTVTYGLDPAGRFADGVPGRDTTTWDSPTWVVSRLAHRPRPLTGALRPALHLVLHGAARDPDARVRDLVGSA
jgi:hypothetical protein